MIELEPHEIKAIQLDILDKFVDYCNKNNLRYTLACGTLIGAIRHKGYIPWDDDIDVAMPRPDYEKMIKHFNGNYEDLVAHDTEIEPEFLYSFGKISNINTVLIENVKQIGEIGVNIDIFPLDGISEYDSLLLKKQVINRMLFNLKIIKSSIKRNIIKNIIILLGRVLLFWLRIESINKRMRKNAKKYSFETEKFCTIVANGNKENKILPKYYFLEYIDCEFENKNYKVIKYYHEWLTSRFGDYMELPSKENQVSHHDYKAYKKDIKILQI